MEQNELPTLLQKYFNQQTSQEETRQAVNWLAQQEVSTPELEQLMDGVWAAGGEKLLDTATSTALLQAVFMAGEAAALQAVMPEVAPVLKVVPVYGRLPLKWLRAAAVVLLIGSLSWWYAQQQPGVDKGAVAVHWQQLHNTGIHVKQVQLADGSHVWLLPGSTLFYPASEAAGSRQLRISGEAYFAIAADARRPMSVLAGGTVTSVLGTAFHIAAYPQESGVYVSLLQGKVVVSTEKAGEDGTRHNLHPGQALDWQRATDRATVYGFDSTTVLAATKGQMAFYELSLYDALQRVALRFGLTIKANAALLPVLQQRKVTGVFTQEKQEDMIQNILFVYGYHYTINGSVITIIP